jgi:hypothetical protein
MHLVKWLYLRLKNKYKETDDILIKLDHLINNYRLVKIHTSNDYIDSICRKHFADYDMEPCDEFTFGFSEEEKNKFRNFAADLINNLT